MGATELSLSDQLQRDIEERNKRIEEARLRASRSQEQDPERASRVLNASAFTGLPNEVVDADLDNIERSILAKDFDVEAYKQQAPSWTSFLAENPYHMAALEKDMENMSYVERSIKQIGLGWDATWAQVDMGLLQNQRIAQGGTFTPEQEARYQKMAELQTEHEFGAEGFVGFLVKNAKMLGPTLHSMGEGLELGAGGAMVAGGSAAIAGQLGPQALIPEEVVTVPGAALVGFNIGMTTGAGKAAFELERGFAYGEYRDMGMDHSTALMASNTVGVVNAALELVSIGKALKYVPGLRQGQERVAKKLTGDVLTRPSMARASATAALRFGEVLGTEVVTEVMQESVTMVTGEIARGDVGEELTWDMYVDRVAATAMEVMQGAFLISTLGPGMSYYGDMRRAQNAGRMQSVFETLAEGAQSSTTRQNNRGAYQAFVRRLKEQGATDNVYIDAERFTTYFQEKGRDPEAVAADTGIDAKDLTEAREIGGDIAIPIDQYAEKIAPTAAGMDLAADLKGSVDAMSAREADLWRANNPEALKQIEELAAAASESAVDTEIEQIVQDVTGQLVSTGYDAGSANKLAQIMRGIGVLARRNNMDPTELYEKIFGGVKRITPQAQAGQENVDMLIDPILNRIRKHDYPAQREMFGPSLLDMINEVGGINPTDPELSAMDFELGAQDRGVSKAKINRWKKEGGTLADLSETAAAQGYIADNDENLLIEAIRKEISGSPVYGSTDAGSAGLRDLSAKMDELAAMIDQAGLDLENMTNEEVRDALAKRDTFLQIDTKALKDLTDLVVQQAGIVDLTADANQVDTSLAELAARLPMVDETQDFGDLQFTDTVRIQETGDTAKVKVSAQRQYDRAVKRKNLIKSLLDCVSG